MRNKRLDILRCIAVVLVIIHHGRLSVFISRVGWIGVDLFFVLSGFLISGLLFSEWKKHHSIDFKRFFIRRGLKIYPAFYVFLLLTAIASYCAFHSVSTPNRYLHEVFFVQNYELGTWDHTWSLAVEEHFYIFLPILLLILARFGRSRENPFRILPWVTLAVAATCIVLRAVSVYVGRPNAHMAYVATHDRMDSLFFGVLLGYVYHFHPLFLEKLLQPTRNRLAIVAVSATLLSFAYLLPPENKFFVTWGYSFLYLGFGGVLLLSLHVPKSFPRSLSRIAARVGNVFAFVGMYSYSIYLWHGPCAAWLPGLIRRTIRFPTGQNGRFTVYFVGSLLLGITMSRLVEYPVLRLRETLFPDTGIVRAPENLDLTSAQNCGPDGTSSNGTLVLQNGVSTGRTIALDRQHDRCA